MSSSSAMELQAPCSESAATHKTTSDSSMAPPLPSNTFRATSTPPSSATAAKSSFQFNYNGNAPIFGIPSSTQNSSPLFGSKPAQSNCMGASASSQAGANATGTTNSTPLFQKPGSSVRRNSNVAPLYGSSWITAVVGSSPEATSFSLHEQLARGESAFIEDAISGESEQKTIKLPCHSPEIFQLFQLWLYNRIIYSAKEGDVSDNVDKEWDRLARAWALGAYLEAPDFRDAVTDAIIEKISSTNNHRQNMHQAIYSSSHPRAPIRKLLVDVANWCWDEAALEAQTLDPHWAEFYYELAVAMMRSRKNGELATRAGSPPWILSPCRYHEHKNADGVCYKSKRQ